MNKFIKTLVLLFLLLAVIYVGYKLYNRYKLYELKQEVSGKFMDQRTPDVTTTTIGGKSWGLQEQKGKVVVAVFWATWCPNCIEEIPQIKKLYEQYKNNPQVEIVSIALDKEREKVEAFIKKSAIPYPVLFEDDKVFENSFAQKVQIVGIPSTWVISKEGKFLAGNLMHMDAVGEIVEKALH